MGFRRVILSFHLSLVAILMLGLFLTNRTRAAEDSSVDSLAPQAGGPMALDVTNSLGSWIWTSTTVDRQVCQLWKSFQIPASAKVLYARLLITADNEFTLFLDGRELGHGAEWRELHDYDVTLLLLPGAHTLAVVAYNDVSFAGMVCGLEVNLSDGRNILIQSDASWRIVPDGTRHWKTADSPAETWPFATIIGRVRGSHWDAMPQAIDSTPILQPVEVYFWQTGWFQISLASVCLVAVIVSGRSLAQLAANRKEQWLLKRERARIARDIHDDLGSRMTQLVLHGEVAQSELPGDSSTRLQIERICEEARGVLATMDEILWAVSPRHDTFSDFTGYVCSYAEEYLKLTAIQCLFDIAPDTTTVTLDLPRRRALLMAVKESLNNAVKHSEANELKLWIAIDGDKLLLSVSDNGKGFDPAQLKSDRNGFANMIDRIHEFGGSCTVTSQPGRGCRIAFSLPLKRARWRFWDGLVKPKPVREETLETKLL